MNEIAEKLIKKAREEIGNSEDPAGSNKIKYNTWYYGYEAAGKNYPWCMTFLQWLFTTCGVKLPVLTPSCGELMRAAQREGLWFTSDFQPGDVAIMDLSGKRQSTQHCGLVVLTGKDFIQTVEGNTSDYSSKDNGGCVCVKTRGKHLVIGVVRAKVLTENKGRNMKVYKTIYDVPPYYRPSVKAAIDAGVVKGEAQDNLGLNEDLCKVIVWLDRLGLIPRG